MSLPVDHYSINEINSLIARFEKQSLPKVEWTHEAHLVVAIWYTWHNDEKNALNLVRDFITRHNASVGTPNNDADGYHETITRFWMWVAKQFLRHYEATNVHVACNAFISSPLSGSKHPLMFYSPELLFSVKARHNWVEPDLNPLETLLEHE